VGTGLAAKRHEPPPEEPAMNLFRHSTLRRIVVVAALGGLALLGACNRRDREPGRDLAPPSPGLPASPALPSSSPTV